MIHRLVLEPEGVLKTLFPLLADHMMSYVLAYRSRTTPSLPTLPTVPWVPTTPTYSTHRGTSIIFWHSLRGGGHVCYICILRSGK